jgi:hypothetical protein
MMLVNLEFLQYIVMYDFDSDILSNSDIWIFW